MEELQKRQSFLLGSSAHEGNEQNKKLPGDTKEEDSDEAAIQRIRSRITWPKKTENVVGLEREKEAMLSRIQGPIDQPEYQLKFGMESRQTSFLLVGVPGTGKTWLSHWVSFRKPNMKV